MRTAQEIALEITDTGKGMDEQLQSTIASAEA
jgi:hypothetical protein